MAAMSQGRLEIVGPLIAVLSLAACDTHDPDAFIVGPETIDQVIELVVEPVEIAADGVSTAVITVITPGVGLDVVVKVSAGTLVESTASPPRTLTKKTDAEGKMITVLRSDTVPQAVRVTAEVDGFLREEPVVFIPVDGTEVLGLTASRPSLPANGCERLVLEARIDPTRFAGARRVTFTTDVGKLVGAVGEGRSLERPFVNGLAQAELESDTRAVTARVGASFEQFQREILIPFDPVKPNDVIKLRTSQPTAEADSVQITQVEAKLVDCLFREGRPIVEFTTSVGTFTKTDSQVVTESAGSGNRVTVDLKSPKTIATTRLTAKVSGFLVDKFFDFVAALPSSIVVDVEGAPEITAGIGNTKTVKVQLRRPAGEGQVSDDLEVEYAAQPVGFFRQPTRSTDGNSQALYTAGDTTFEGTVTIVVSMDEVSGTTQIRVKQP